MKTKILAFLLAAATAQAQIIISQPATAGGGSATWGSIGGVLSNQSDLQSALDAKTTLPSLSGNTGKYLTNDGTNLSWATVAGGGGGAWGSITGTLSSQTDLQSALDAKEPTITAGTTSQFWRGDKSWQGLSSSDIGNWPSAVRTTTVSIVTLTNSAIVSTDTIQAALGKAQAQINAIPLVPSQSGNSGKYLTTNGTSLSWGTPAGGGGSVAWGSITGTLSDQTDLNSALSGKESSITSGTTGQFWRGDKSWQALAPSDMSGFNAGVIGALPTQSGQSGKYLTTNGSTLSWGTPAGGGGGSSPTTTQGDMIYRGAGADSRLAIGLPGASLEVAWGIPTWKQPFNLETWRTATNQTGSGASASLNPSSTPPANSPGMTYEIYMGTTSGGAGEIVFSPTITAGQGYLITNNFADIIFGGFLTVPTLSNGTDTFVTSYGFLGSHGAVTVAVTNMVGFRIEDAAVKGVCMSSGTETTVTWGTSLSAGQSIFVMGVWHRAAGWVEFFVDGTSIGTIATNIPTSVHKLEFLSVKTAGTTGRSVYLSLPWAKLYQ